LSEPLKRSDCIRHAHECVIMAGESTAEHEKKWLLEIAKAWLELARVASDDETKGNSGPH
jgi:hypothetical protein